MKNICHNTPQRRFRINIPGILARYCLLLSVFIGATFTHAQAQTFFIKENFSNTVGNTAPQGWENIRLSGGSGVGFRFDNSTNLQVPYPLQAPFAIFDPTATPWQGTSQTVTLQSPEIDLSGVSSLLLSVDHKYLMGADATGRIQTWADNVWTDVAVFTAPTSGVETSTYDVSSLLAGKKAGRLRFMWTGKQEGHWMIDNVKLYAPAGVDAGISSIDVPKDPFGEGTSDISVTLLNYGSTTLNNAKIKWSVNGVVQPDASWSGSLAFAQKKPAIRIGQMNLRAGVSYLFKIWSEDPNGQYDDNPTNDTIVRTLIPSLCGTYTIGGSNPNFQTITRAVEFLHSAGIGCPVVMKIRDGVYNEQLELKKVRGASITNTITFEGEKGDSASVLLTSTMDATTYQYTMHLNGSENIIFRNMEFMKLGYGDYQALLISSNSKNIVIEECTFKNTFNSTTGVVITNDATLVDIKNNTFKGPGYVALNMNTTGKVSFMNNIIIGGYYIPVTGIAGKAFIENNFINGSQSPIQVNISDSGTVRNNKILFAENGLRIHGSGDIFVDANEVNYTAGVGIYTDATKPIISNNIINNRQDLNNYALVGIHIAGGNGTQILFNTIRLTKSTKESATVSITNGDSIRIKGNIFTCEREGVVFKIDKFPGFFQLEKNNYFSKSKTLANVKGTIVHKLLDWQRLTSSDIGSINLDPGFSSDSTYIPSLIYLNENGSSGTPIKNDFNSKERNNLKPDIGAIEFNPCQYDAALESFITPENPIINGKNEISILVRNNGVLPVKSLKIRWLINNTIVADTVWNGLIESSKTSIIQLGSFSPTSLDGVTIRAFIQDDTGCTRLNDTITTDKLFSKLCGIYTIGGNKPDFISLSEATKALQFAGITCNIVFRIRDGVYKENIWIDSIPGSISTNTITFESENQDSSKVIIKNDISDKNQLGLFTILSNSSFVFNRIGINIEGDSRYTGILSGGQTNKVEIKNCSFVGSINPSCIINRGNRLDSMIVINNKFSNTFHIGIRNESTGNGIISNNIFEGVIEHAISGNFKNITSSNNYFNKVVNGIYVHALENGIANGNKIIKCETGIRVDGGNVNIRNNQVNFGWHFGIWSTSRYSEIINNWIYNIADHDNNSGIGLSIECFFSKSVHNTIFLSKGNLLTKAFLSNGGDSLHISSNIFSTIQGIYPVELKLRPRALNLNYNDYFSQQSFFGKIENTEVKNINEWRNYTNGESRGLFGNPYFKNDSSLIPGLILLNGSGEESTNIDTDIDGVLRSKPRPDIGAKEFDPCDSDIGLLNFTEPNSPLDVGIRNIKLVIQNNGKSTISQTKISWRINDGIIKDTIWKGTLMSGQTDTVTIGNYDFKTLIEYQIKSWITNDVNFPDCLKENDTLFSRKLYARLCGNFTVGGINPDFKTLRDAANFLRDAGISCPVTLRIRNGVYREKFSLDSINGSSRLNTITFESETGNADSVLITSEQNMGHLDKYTIQISNTGHIRFRLLTIGSFGYDPGQPSLLIKGKSNNISLFQTNFFQENGSGKHISILEMSDSVTIIQNNFKGNSDGGVYVGNNGHVQITESSFVNITGTAIFLESSNNVLLLRNKFKPGMHHAIFGIARRGEIKNNEVESVLLAIRMATSDSVSILNNKITQSVSGIQILGDGKFLVSANNIGFTNGTGIEAIETKNANIINNWAYNQRLFSTNGISIIRGNNSKVLFNSINITGTNNNSSAIAIQGGKDNQVFNNILKNASGGYCMKIIGGTERLLSDYNCYYAPLNNVGSIDERIYNSLSLWGNIINGESNSIFTNPFFKSNSEFRPNHILLNDAGITINPVKFDIDSTLRHPVSPDMGVKEFTPCNNDAGINEFTSPVLPMGAGKQDIRVILQNQGLGTINSVRIHWSVNGAVQPSFDWTGTLPTRKNVEVQIGQMEFLAGPEWNIRAWTSQPNGIADCNNYNDTTLLFVPGTPNSVPYPPTARDTSVCIGNSAKIYAKGVGRLGWYTAPTGGTWLGSDSILVTPPLFATTTYYVQDSVLKASLARTPVKVNVFTPPPFDAVPDRIYSRADVYTLGIDTSLKGYDHRWSSGDSSATIQVKHSGGFSVRFTTPDGCRLTDSVFIQFPDTAILRAATVNGSCVVPVDVPVSVGNFRRITQFMGELSWDTARLSFDSIRIYPSLGMQEKDFNTSMTMAGRLSFSWAAPSASWKSLPDSTIIFAVRLVPTTALLTDLQVNLSIDTARFFFYNDQPKKLKTTAINGTVKVTSCLMQLEGKVITPLDEGVVNVQMSLAGPESRQTMTKQDGTYSLSAAKGNYTLTPFKNNEKEKLNGISTLDLALIQSHILLRQRLGNAYKVIAADANQSGSVTTVDIMHLRRMLLRMDTSLPGNRTWAFVDADRTFSNPNTPFPFSQNKTLAERFGKVTHTFRAIKLGDVNYDRNPKLDQANGTDTLKLFADFGQPEGTRMKVSIKAEAIRQLMGFQGTLAWDTSRIMLEKITANPLQIAVSDHTMSQGMLMFSWNDSQATGMDMSQGTTLFELVFRRIDPNQKAVIRLADEHLMREAFDAQFQRLQMTLTKAILAADPLSDTYFRAFPNPAKDHVTIHWKTADHGPAVIRIIDMHGRILMEQRTEMQAGVNQYRIDLNRKFSQGSYLIQIEQAGATRSHQMLISN